MRDLCEPCANGTHLLQYGNSVSWHGDRIQGFVLEDSVENFVLVVATERRLSEKHLVYKHAESPPIDRSTVLLLEEDLQTHFLGHVSPFE